MSDYQISVTFATVPGIKNEPFIVDRLKRVVEDAVQDWHFNYGKPLSILREMPAVKLERIPD